MNLPPPDWQRSDTIAMVALIVSIFSAFFTGLQWWLAYRRARDEKRARWPAVEARLVRPLAPDWWEVRIDVRNRIDTRLVLERLRVHRPRAARLFREIRARGGYVIAPFQPPAPGTCTKEMTLELELEVAPTSAASTGARSVELAVCMRASSSSSSRARLTMSLEFRVINESAPHALIMVTTKAPVLSTNTDT